MCSRIFSTSRHRRACGRIWQEQIYMMMQGKECSACGECGAACSDLRLTELTHPIVTSPIIDRGLMARIDSIVFSNVRSKLQNSEDGKGWSFEMAIQVEREYRYFLWLTAAYAGVAIVPCRSVDDFWHQHILDTRAYMRDCERVFGFYLHHFPYFGMSGPEDARNLQQAWQTTIHLYAKHFSEPPVGFWGRGVTCSDCRQCSACGRDIQDSGATVPSLMS